MGCHILIIVTTHKSYIQIIEYQYVINANQKISTHNKINPRRNP